MTTERKYRCNLCRDEISPDSPPPRGLVDGMGVHFEGSQLCAPFRFVSVREAENHICGSCISNVRKNSA